MHCALWRVVKCYFLYDNVQYNFQDYSTRVSKCKIKIKLQLVQPKRYVAGPTQIFFSEKILKNCLEKLTFYLIIRQTETHRGFIQQEYFYYPPPPTNLLQTFAHND